MMETGRTSEGRTASGDFQRRPRAATPETRERLDALGAEIKIDTPETFGKMIASQLALWNSVVAAAGIKGE